MDSEGWHIDIIDTADQLLGFYGGMATDGSGRIHVTYTKEGDLMYATRQSPAMAVEENHAALPGKFDLFAYPNPFNSATMIMAQGVDEANIAIFDIAGRKVAALHAEHGRAAWNAKDLDSGVYFARVSGKSPSSVIKLVYLK
jgi:hypothetical protein